MTDLIGTHYVIPIRRRFPIWRSGFRLDLVDGYIEDPNGWYPDWYRYHKVWGADVERAAERMRAWAEQHPEADTQGLMPDEWTNLALAALSIPTRGDDD